MKHKDPAYFNPVFTEELNLFAFNVNKDLKEWKPTYQDLENAIKELRNTLKSF